MIKEVNQLVKNTKEFAVDSSRFLHKCTKPDKKGKDKICRIYENFQLLCIRICCYGSHWICY